MSQYYLTSQSPPLRRKLLKLIANASKCLCTNEDEFLPVVNDIWPVVIKRLYDEEAIVALAAAEAVVEICKAGGDFLSTRLVTEWPDLKKLAWQTRHNALSERNVRGGRGMYSHFQQLWQAIIHLLVNIVECVRIDEEIFDEVLDILEDLFITREDVRKSLSLVNADAVWLKLHTRGNGTVGETPVVEGYSFYDARRKKPWLLE
jgi:hypothetical protein